MGMQSALESGNFIASFLIGHLLLIPVIYFASKRFEMPEVTPWRDFGEDAGFPTESVGS
jgi:hypothetical protein